MKILKAGAAVLGLTIALFAAFVAGARFSSANHLEIIRSMAATDAARHAAALIRARSEAPHACIAELEGELDNIIVRTSFAERPTVLPRYQREDLRYVAEYRKAHPYESKRDAEYIRYVAQLPALLRAHTQRCWRCRAR